jgi:hypothetical protein
MIPAEKSQRASARSLGFEQARMTALFVDVMMITDDLTRYSDSYQSAVPIADRTIHVYVPTQDAGEHAVCIALAESDRALLEGNRNVALDELFGQVCWQIQLAEAGPEDCECFFVSMT